MKQAGKRRARTSTAKPWFERDEFWTTVRPFIFDPARVNATPEQVEGLLALTGLKAGARVLDLCCGVGRHSLELARRGFKVTGVDRTVAYLKQARQQARREGLNIEFVQQDMREFVRPRAFDLAMNLFTSFGYFDDPNDDLKVVTNVFNSLTPGGSFVIDVHGKETLARIFTERGWYETEGYTVLEDRRIHPGWAAISNRWIIYHGGERKEFSFTLRLYSATELTALLQSVGFGSVSTYGSLRGAPYDTAATRLIAVARK